VTTRVAGRRWRSGTRHARLAALSTLVVGGAAFIAPPADAQALPAGYEQGIFELRVARIAAETVPGLLSPSGAVLVPLDRAVTLTGVPTRRTDSTITVERARNAGSATLRFASRTLADRIATVQLGADELIRFENVYYLAAPRLAQLFGATVQADLGQLSVTMTRTPPFPVEQAAARAQRTAGGVAHTAGVNALSATPFVPRSGGAVMDWTASTVGTMHGVGSSNGSLRGAAALYGGDVAAGATIGDDGVGGVRTSAVEWSYRRGFPGNQWLRELQVGDILGGGAELRSLRGVTLTNARLVHDATFGSIPIDLSLPQGWQYEVYQDNQLVGFSDAGVRSPVYVPLRYGATPVQVRLVSPTGDETIRDYSYLIPQTQQQPGRFEYTAGAGRCAFACTSLAYGQGAYGVTPWLSVSLGAERRTTDSVSRTLPQGGLSVLTYSGWNAQVQAARATFTRASLLYGGAGRLIGSGSYSRTYTGVDQPSVIAAADQGRWLLDGQLQLRADIDDRVSGWRLDNTMEGVASSSGPDRSRSALTAELRGGSVGVAYETDRTRGLHDVGLTGLAVLPAGWHVSSALGTVLFDQHAVHAIELATSLQTGRRGAAAMTLRWQREAGMVFSVGLNGALGAMRLTSRLSASRAQPAYLASAASGTVALDGTHRPALFEGPGVGLSGVAGRVFYDVDGDGTFGAGDLPASNVRVVVSGAQVRSDSSGAYHAWNVVPYEPSAIAIDTLAFTDFSWTLLRGRTALRATPGTFNRIDFPLVRTRELAGQVVGDSTIATVGGVTLLLTSASGAVQRLVTYSDGSFYVSRMLPGRYTLTVAPSALDALHAVAEPVAMPVEISLVAEDPVLTLPSVRLRQRP
jgi:hypothetical protein